MKRLAAVVLCMVMLLGCAADDDTMDRVLALRRALQESNGVGFKATVTADYGQKLQTFVLSCQSNPSGTVSFQVLAPDTIGGITGTVSGEAGRLTFDDEILVFSPMADGQLAPVTAPWVLVHTLLGGYISSCGETKQGLIVSMADSYADDALRLDVRLDSGDLPVSAEILWQGRRILSMKIENFEIL